MAAWDDTIRAALKLAGKGADEIEKVIANLVKAGAGGVDNVAEDVAKVATKAEPSAAEVAMMSKAERTAYNAAKAVKDREATGAAATILKAKSKLKNVREGEDLINTTLGEASKTKLGTQGLAEQFNKFFKKSELGTNTAVLKRTMNDPDFKALMDIENKGVARAKEEVFAAINAAKADGKPMTNKQIVRMIQAKAKEIMTEVEAGSKSKSVTDIEAIKARAAEGGRKLSDKEQAAIAAKEKAAYSTSKERAEQVATQSKALAAGGDKAIVTRVETLKGLTPEEQRMSGIKGKLYSEKTRAESTGATAFIDKLKAMAADKKLLPIMKDGKQVTEEIIIDGKKMTVPKYETRAEQSLRLEKQKPVEAKDLQADDGKPSAPPKTPEELRNIRAEKESVVTESSKKLTEQQTANVKKGAEEGASQDAKVKEARLAQIEKDYGRVFPSGSEPKNPAAAAALKQIQKDYNRGVIDEKEYLSRLKDVSKISGEAVTKAEVAANEYSSAAQRIRSKQVVGQMDAKLEDKFGKGYTTKAGESGSTVFVPAEVPVSQLKGRKWVRDAAGKLVLAKK